MINMTDMRQEIFHLETDLTHEQLKRRALEEELHNPLNIHRWRKLEVSLLNAYVSIFLSVKNFEWNKYQCH
jgi:hypothetical protein